MLSDADRDGYALRDQPADRDPFNSTIHPYALYVPGNGVDENGLAGDPPLAPSSEADSAAHHGHEKRVRPHVLITYLERFRADLLGKESDGRPITPYLNAIADEGASSDRAWAHAP